jgi:hypothetical protein
MELGSIASAVISLFTLLRMLYTEKTRAENQLLVLTKIEELRKEIRGDYVDQRVYDADKKALDFRLARSARASSSKI